MSISIFHRKAFFIDYILTIIQFTVTTIDKLGIDINTGMRTVYNFLESRGGLAVLDNPHIQAATREILSERGKTRHDIQVDIKRKERAIDKIAADHRSRNLSTDEIKVSIIEMSFTR